MGFAVAGAHCTALEQLTNFHMPEKISCAVLCWLNSNDCCECTCLGLLIQQHIRGYFAVYKLTYIHTPKW